MIAQRVFAVLAAMLLVGAVALATLGPPEVPLGQMLFMIDHDLMGALHGGIERHLWVWMWDYLVQPLMVRPAWLVPACMHCDVADAVDAQQDDAAVAPAELGENIHRRGAEDAEQARSHQTRLLSVLCASVVNLLCAFSSPAVPCLPRTVGRSSRFRILPAPDIGIGVSRTSTLRGHL